VVNVEPCCCFILVDADHESLAVKYLNSYGCVISAYFLMCRDVSRVEKDETAQKHCTGQYFDYWSCVDKCVSNLH
jgi:hypothetical protein